ncbi:transcriptional regulator, LacI family [Marinitoga hydrogenitolerans DSM 16785]|uniref:Transcriptional regulator, LacI family n=1 Tax=Marinitoga hydrogenitolerans (strain DSM 16785 / JCM 12826 / AT1271) TaxID=1122195 RepID=A0A1M5ADZ9_MARH1|nr:LacI family DNA-binding transcriptional regulator [Marinitoga hydrogenitolerans]SHF28306.1 transcriptional regulator, LacI family [Marinitoga hydrogenitolerans DSM 16785]
MATLREISKKIGISIATISRVINGYDNVSDETRKKVLKALKEFHYQLPQVAKKRLHYLVGILVPDLRGNHYNIISEGIEEELTKHGYDSFVTSTYQLLNKEIEILEQFFSRRVDGIIICTTRNDDEHIERLIRSAIPVVAVDRMDSSIKVDTIGIDNYQSAYMGVKYLYNKGHRNILFIQGNKDVYSSKLRKKAVLDFSKKFKIKVTILKGNFEFEGGYFPVKKYLENNDKDFTAIFFSNDQMALGGMKAIYELGYSIPEDISILGFDDDSYSKYLFPPLTTIKQPRNEMGKIAAQLIIERITGKGSKVKRKILLPTEIIERCTVKNIL